MSETSKNRQLSGGSGLILNVYKNLVKKQSIRIREITIKQCSWDNGKLEKPINRLEQINHKVSKTQ